MPQIPIPTRNATTCGLCARLVLYSKTSTTNCSSSPPLILLSSLFLFHCLHQPPLAMVLCLPQLEHWSLTSVLLCGLDAAHLFSLSAFSLLFIRCIPFPCSDQSTAVGSSRGWEIPSASSHCMTIHDNTRDLQLSAQRENQDHLVSKLRPARPKTFTLFSSLPLTLIRV